MDKTFSEKDILKNINENIKKPVLQERCVLEIFANLAVCQRTVLSLRCYDKMSFAEISRIMNCRKWKVKKIFKSALIRLSRALKANEINEKMFIPFLIIFGIITGEKNTKIDILRLRELIGGQFFLISIRKFIFTSLIALIFCVSSQGAEAINPDSLARQDVKSVRYATQGTWIDKGQLKSKGFYEKWLYFPGNPDGPVFYRMQRWGHKNLTGKLCSWLQNENGFYYYHCGKKTVYISNDPLSLRFIPTDGKKFMDYVSEVLNIQSNVEYTWNKDGTLLKSITDSRIDSVGTYTCQVRYNDTSPDFFDYDNWVGEAKIVDMRDKMRKRGWTYFEITGEYEGKKVTGSGRIPFTYNMKQKYPPWLEINIEDTVRIIDCNNIAVVQTKSGEHYYRSGSFFLGLHKPWQGYRVEEAVARDAIRYGGDISKFMSNMRVDYTKGGEKVEIYYMLSGNENLIKMITVRKGDKQGSLMLKYHQKVDELDEKFIKPKAELSKGGNISNEKLHWLVDILADTDGMGDCITEADKTVEEEQDDMDELRKQLRKCRPPMY